MRVIEYTIKDESGIHARPAGLLVKCAGGFSADVTAKCHAKSADCKKIFSVMSLGVKCGDTVEFTIVGSDEDSASEAIEAFLKENL